MKNRNNDFLKMLQKIWGYIETRSFLLSPIAYGLYILLLSFVLWGIIQKYSGHPMPSESHKMITTTVTPDVITTLPLEAKTEQKPGAMRLLEARVTTTEKNIASLQEEINEINKNDTKISKKIETLEKKYDKKLLKEVNEQVDKEVATQIKDIKKETQGAKKRKKTLTKLIDALAKDDE